MKRTIKRIIKAALTTGVVVGFVLMLGEGKDFRTDLMWSITWMAEMAVCGWLRVRLFPEDFKSEVVL